MTIIESLTNLSIGVILIMAALMVFASYSTENTDLKVVKIKKLACADERGKLHRVSGVKAFIGCIEKLNQLKFLEYEKLSLKLIFDENNEQLWLLTEQVNTSHCHNLKYVWHIDKNTLKATKQRDHLIVC